MRGRAAGVRPVFLLTAAIAAGETQTVPLFAPAADRVRHGCQGLTRVVNLSNRAGTVSVRARDDDGALRRTSFRIAASGVYHFNSDDLENGNAVKGIAGIGAGDWRLALDSELPIAVTASLGTKSQPCRCLDGADAVHRSILISRLLRPTVRPRAAHG